MRFNNLVPHKYSTTSFKNVNKRPSSTAFVILTRGSFFKPQQLFFAFFLQPNPPLKIPFVAPDFSLLFHPVLCAHCFLPSQILNHRQMVIPNGTVTKLNQHRARHLIAARASIETFLVHAAFVNVAAPLMLQAGAASARATAAMATLVLQIINARATIETAGSSKLQIITIAQAQPSTSHVTQPQIYNP